MFSRNTVGILEITSLKKNLPASLAFFTMDVYSREGQGK